MKKLISSWLLIIVIVLAYSCGGDSGGSSASFPISNNPTCKTALTGGINGDLVGSWQSSASNANYNFPNDIFTLNADGTCTANWIWNGQYTVNGGPCHISDYFNVVRWSVSGDVITFKQGRYIVDNNDQVQFAAVSVDTYWWEVKSSDTNTLSLQIRTLGGGNYYVFDGNGDLTCPVSGISSRIVSNNPSLVSIQVTPINDSAWTGIHEGTQFSATGVYSDNSTQNLTNQVTWSSSDSLIATITAAGLATGKLPVGASTATVTITATLGITSGSTSLKVYPPDIKSITIAPSSASVQKGNTVQYAATGTFSDGTTSDITTTVAWTSSNTNIAICSGTTSGLVTGVNVGTAYITATATYSIGTLGKSVPLYVY